MEVEGRKVHPCREATARQAAMVVVAPSEERVELSLARYSNPLPRGLIGARSGVPLRPWKRAPRLRCS
jgi:hypothetical protein